MNHSLLKMHRGVVVSWNGGIVVACILPVILLIIDSFSVVPIFPFPFPFHAHLAALPSTFSPHPLNFSSSLLIASIFQKASIASASEGPCCESTITRNA
jgi:hypothetical protein